MSRDRRRRSSSSSPPRRDRENSRHRERGGERRQRRKSRSASRSPARQRRRQHKRSRSRSRSQERQKRGGSGERRERNQKMYESREERAQRMKGGDRKGDEGGNEGEEQEKQGPNFETSGKLLEDTNVFNGVVVKYSEPPEAKKPKKRWRFYVFKGEESLPTLHLHRQSAFLLGKDRKVVDVPIDHPSCSRQHAVLQYRVVQKRVLPYIIDLGSSNGTYLNNKRIDPQRYYELREKDMLKFGYSSREYVLLHEQSQDDDDD